MRRETGRSTLTGIASAAGVSVSTVSKVLNGRTDVAPGTRDRISKLLRSHGYQVVAGMRFGVADLLIGSLHGPWAEELIRGAVDAAREAGHSIVVTPVSTGAEFSDWVERAARRGTDGLLSVLYLPTVAERDRLAGAHIPLILVDPPTEPGSDIRSVGTTNWQGGLTATRHLAELGHRRIGAIGGPERFWSANARLDGYRTALMRSGLPVDEDLVVRGEFAVPDGRDLARQLLDRPSPPTAIVAGNDNQAFGILQALGERGLRVPDDVSLVGFDDAVAAWATPPLTTIRQPLAAMTAAAVRMLRMDADGVAAQPQHVELATSLVVRESTRPPRAA
ncbi:MAG TPA: LacI family DNA-binding transcriptional regulator [Streptosporangiaceae bacterium]|jgi:DNA-binding LacI/PurR family transcriptional regulator|nr:LacI family DNA-binding transcriptional regulator [Streptosporangiaceae bacterium]